MDLLEYSKFWEAIRHRFRGQQATYAYQQYASVFGGQYYHRFARELPSPIL